jgi:cytochrome c oxidase subunit 2
VVPESAGGGIGGAAEVAPQTMADAGTQQFQALGCQSCHHDDGSGAGPSLVGLWGTQVELASGETVTADADYVRRSILDPQAQIVAGHQPIMPTYSGQVDETELLNLVEYIQSLGTAQEGGEAVPEEEQQ